MEALVRDLITKKILQFGEFRYKSGKIGKSYFDMRALINYPHLQERVYDLMYLKMSSDHKLCGVPMGGMLIVSALAQRYKRPFIVLRNERKDHGLQRRVEGIITADEPVILVEDVVTTGGSIASAITALGNEQIRVTEIVAFLDRRAECDESLCVDGIYYPFRAVLTLDELREIMVKIQRIPFDLRLPYVNNDIARKMLEIIITKRSNLIFAADVSTVKELLQLAEQTGDHICAIKTHVDILEDYSLKAMTKLREIARRKNFLIIEDRKFADIGNTVREQFVGGVHQISQFADIVIVHSLFGAGTIKGLDTNIFLLAESSSAENLIDAEYTQKTVALGRRYREKVIGFICQQKVADDSFIHITPGINKLDTKDALGQQYCTPYSAIIHGFTDVIIVGRGIYNAGDPAEATRGYQEEAWAAHLESLDLTFFI